MENLWNLFLAPLHSFPVTILLVPHGVGQTSATLWVGAVDEPAGVEADLELQLNGHPLPLGEPSERWRRFGRTVDVWRITVDGLSSATRHSAELRRGRAIIDLASFSTLPDRLPGAAQIPFTLFLASCFSVGCDREHRAGRAFRVFALTAPPPVKFLMGDQVYLDSPWHDYLLRPGMSDEELVGRLLDHYVSTWSRHGQPAPGYGDILRYGACCFTPDDHELWNNSPNVFPLIPQTWRASTRKLWHTVATELYDLFQSPPHPPAGRGIEFRVPPLSFRTIDTRMDRERGDRRFMREEDLDSLRDWIDRLEGPGVLVCSQPVLFEPGTWCQRLKDMNLPDFEQYGRLAEALARARHSLVVLAGDVHYARVARCDLRAGGEIVEVISSPLSLVSPSVAGASRPAPAAFPARPVPGVPQVPVETKLWGALDGMPLNQDHFMSAEFHSAGGRAVEMAVRFWPVRSPHDNRLIYRRTLR